MGSFVCCGSPQEVLDDLELVMGAGFDTDTDSLEEIGGYIDHVSGIFPADTANTMTLQGGAQNVFGAWTRLVDAPGGAFFDALLTEHVHIAAINIESEAVGNSIWMLEISYGATNIVVGRVRWVSTIAGLFASVQQYRVRSAEIPTGERVYGRLMCSNVAANQTAVFHIRYYMHT